MNTGLAVLCILWRGGALQLRSSYYVTFRLEHLSTIHRCRHDAVCKARSATVSLESCCDKPLLPISPDIQNGPSALYPAGIPPKFRANGAIAILIVVGGFIRRGLPNANDAIPSVLCTMLSHQIKLNREVQPIEMWNDRCNLENAAEPSRASCDLPQGTPKCSYKTVPGGSASNNFTKYTALLALKALRR